MPADMFLKIDGIPGESQDHKHSGEIELISVDWSAIQKSSMGTGGGGGVGKVDISDISVVKKTDKASLELLKHCANGKHIATATLTLRKAGEQPLEYLKIKLSDVIISSYRMSAQDGGDIPTEMVSLSFAKVQTEYAAQSAKGTGEGAVTFGWDVTKNTQV